jgi:hypothetical protein
MTIDLTDKSVDPLLSKIFQDIGDKAVGMQFAFTLPTVETTPYGKIVVYDDGLGTKRIYIKTGQGNLGYVNLT